MWQLHYLGTLCQIYLITAFVFPAGTWRKYNVASTLMQRHDVASTLRRRYIYVMYPLGLCFNIVYISWALFLWGIKHNSFRNAFIWTKWQIMCPLTVVLQANICSVQKLWAQRWFPVNTLHHVNVSNQTGQICIPARWSAPWLFHRAAV